MSFNLLKLKETSKHLQEYWGDNPFRAELEEGSRSLAYDICGFALDHLKNLVLNYSDSSKHRVTLRVNVQNLQKSDSKMVSTLATCTIHRADSRRETERKREILEPLRSDCLTKRTQHLVNAILQTVTEQEGNGDLRFKVSDVQRGDRTKFLDRSSRVLRLNEHVFEIELRAVSSDTVLV